LVVEKGMPAVVTSIERSRPFIGGGDSRRGGEESARRVEKLQEESAGKALWGV
jgi:hypothetical protein